MRFNAKVLIASLSCVQGAMPRMPLAADSSTPITPHADANTHLKVTAGSKTARANAGHSEMLVVFNHKVDTGALHLRSCSTGDCNEGSADRIITESDPMRLSPDAWTWEASSSCAGSKDGKKGSVTFRCKFTGDSKIDKAVLRVTVEGLQITRTPSGTTCPQEWLGEERIREYCSRAYDWANKIPVKTSSAEPLGAEPLAAIPNSSLRTMGQ